MTTPFFFEGERQRFFRPLNSSRRELVAACLRALYQRLHSPSADHAHNLTRDGLRDLLMPVVREYGDRVAADSPADEFNSPEVQGDPPQLVNIMIRALLNDGWLEQFADRQGLVTAFRFTRPGKLFAEALWSLDRPSRSRQRNMRGCRNALAAALSERGDAHDLVDAFEYAERVIEDLSEGTEFLQELLRKLVSDASVHTQWDDVVEFLERFRREHAKQLTSDNALLNREAIRKLLEQLRAAPEPKFQRMEQQLTDIARWAADEHGSGPLYDWLLGRIEELVDAACETKQPGFVKAMDSYLKRLKGLLLQSMMLRSGRSRHAYMAAIGHLARAAPQQQDRLLARIGEQIASAEVRLLDPVSFKLRTATQRRRSVTVTIRPMPTREERLASSMDRAEAEAFSVSNEDIAERLRADLRLFQHPVRLSTLPSGTAREVVALLQAVEAARTARGGDFLARKLPLPLENEFYRGSDYEIELKP